MANKKYYFIYYSCFSRTWKPDGIHHDSYTTMNQDIIDIHPLQWQLDCNEKYEPIQDSGGSGYTKSESYTVVTWNELTKTEYDLYKYTVG